MLKKLKEGAATFSGVVFFGGMVGFLMFLAFIAMGFAGFFVWCLLQ